jgi:hypothetical protein
MVNQALRRLAEGGAMRLALALILGLALAAPAYGQKIPPKPAKPTSVAAKLGLRGPVSPDATPDADAPAADPSKQAPLAAAPPLPPLLAPLAPPRPDAGRCRLTCASDYYFCLANEATDSSCPDTWSQCRAACDAPSGARQIGAMPGA